MASRLEFTRGYGLVQDTILALLWMNWARPKNSIQNILFKTTVWHVKIFIL